MMMRVGEQPPSDAELLGSVGYYERGIYDASATYSFMNVVGYDGDSYVALKDNLKGVTPSNDGVNWRIFSSGGVILPPEMHRNIYRGKNLGTAVTDEQWAAIADGTFTDLYVGDYWVMGGKNWRIADIDYWWTIGDTVFTKHHLVIMPDQTLYSAKMNDTNTTAGGYVGSAMYTTNLEQAKATIKQLFEEAHVLSHREYLTNAVADGHPSAGAWYDSDVELPNEILMYGCQVFTTKNTGSGIPNLYTADKTQLALFRLRPQLIHYRYNWFWLRDIVSATFCASVSGYGYAFCSDASSSGGVRPVFPIGT